MIDIPRPNTSPSVEPSRIDLNPDSPYTDAFAVYMACDRAQLAALETTAQLFLTDVISHLGLLNLDSDAPYRHATLTETAHRFARARLGDSSADGNVGACPLAETAAGTAGESENGSVAPGTDTGRGLQLPESGFLPGFPRFKETQTIDGWVHMFSHAEDIAELSAIRGSTTSGTYAHVTSAMTLVHGLPNFHARCLAGDFTIEHVQAATQLCRGLAFSKLPAIDSYLNDRRADITIETFRKSLAMKIAILQPVEERTRQAHERRRVDVTTYPDGSACLTLTGPAADLQALYVRIEAFAKAIRNGNTAAFADQLPEDAEIEDERGIDALMFDILTRTVPQVRIQVRTTDTDSGETTTTDIPLDRENAATATDIADVIVAAGEALGSSNDPSGTTSTSTAVRAGAGADADADSGAGTDAARGAGCSTTVASGVNAAAADLATDDHSVESGIEAEAAPISSAGRPRAGDPFEGTLPAPAADGGCRNSSELVPEAGLDELGRASVSLVVSMPTSEYWLVRQARVITTVPCLTLTGDADLPGTFSNGAPIPAETARRIAAHSSTWTRILTDPATGTPTDTMATTYQIPQALRQTLIAQWRGCSAPGCRRRAENSEIDHIIPFDHDDPLRGGKTVFGNLHPLCKLHHQAKTDGRYAVRMDVPGVLEYRFAHGVAAVVAPPDHPVNAVNGKLLQDLGSAVRSRVDPPEKRRPDPEPEDPPRPRTGSPSLPCESPTSPVLSDLEPGASEAGASEPGATEVGARRSGAPGLPVSESTEAELIESRSVQPVFAESRSVEPDTCAPKPDEVRKDNESSPSDGGSGAPGRVKRRNMIRCKDDRRQAWVWDNGEPPPF